MRNDSQSFSEKKFQEQRFKTTISTELLVTSIRLDKSSSLIASMWIHQYTQSSTQFNHSREWLQDSLHLTLQKERTTNFHI